MGKCNNCGKEITLKDGEKNCPYCGQPPYFCWSCKTPITGEEKECSVCHFFRCLNCGRCGSKCMIPELMLLTIGLSRRETVVKIYESITAPKRKTCPTGVPISYAHAKLRNMALRLQGLLTKNDNDREEFEARFEKIIEYPIGKTWTINQVKKDGEYGIEFREVSNLLICMGKVKKKKCNKKNEGGEIIKEWEEYERTEGRPCENMNWDKLISKYCVACKITYEKEVDYCHNCSQELKQRSSHIGFCSLGRKYFIEKED